MPAVNTNLDNKQVLTTPAELIAFFKESDSPWASFFPIETQDTTDIAWVIKKPSNNIQKVTDKSVRLDSKYAETEKVERKMKNMYTDSQYIAEIDLKADNGQKLQDSMEYEVANNMLEQIAADDTTEIYNRAYVMQMESLDPVKILQAMLKAWDYLFQQKHTKKVRFFGPNSTYDQIVYLADNKGLITDNTIAQQLRLDGSKLFIKGTEFQVVPDDYITSGENKMPFVLATPKAMKRFYLEEMTVYRKPVNDGKTPLILQVAGEVMSDAFAYVTSTEEKSRWMVRGEVTAAEVEDKKQENKDSKNQAAIITTDGKQSTLDDIVKLFKTTFSKFEKTNEAKFKEIKDRFAKIEANQKNQKNGIKPVETGTETTNNATDGEENETTENISEK